mmetsp:Transcript_21951/g.86056  ORF Transcript_21951/g.86056 Transcript_21951/m.86056 type:complete len:204 (-) Transcript_21951:2249-2860(-)
MPLARPLRASRHPADGGRCRTHPCQLPGRCGRPAQCVRRGADLGCAGRHHREAQLRPVGRADRRHAEGRLRQRRRRHGGPQAARGPRRGRAHGAGHPQCAGRRWRPTAPGRARSAGRPPVGPGRDARRCRCHRRRRQGPGRGHRSLCRRTHEPLHRPRPDRSRCQPALRIAPCPSSPSCRTPSTAPRVPASTQRPARRSAKRC